MTGTTARDDQNDIKVDIYNDDETPHALGASLRESLGDEADEFEDIKKDIESGACRYFGGGAAPLYIIKPHKPGPDRVQGGAL